MEMIDDLDHIPAPAPTPIRPFNVRDYVRTHVFQTEESGKGPTGHPRLFPRDVTGANQRNPRYIHHPRPRKPLAHAALTAYIHRDYGTGEWLAKKIGVSSGLLSRWASGNRPIPLNRCYQIEAASKGLLRCEDLRPDVRWQSRTILLETKGRE